MQLATLCYLRLAGSTLMLHRNKSGQDIHFGKWNGLGGKFLPGESPEDCVHREIFEESGLSLIQLSLSGILSFPEFKNGEDWLVFVFTSSKFQGELTDCREGTLEWIPDDKILSLNLWEGDRYFLPHLLEGRFFSGKFVYQDNRLVNHSLVLYDAAIPAL